MANIDQRLRRLELTFAAVAGGAAVLLVLVLGFFGFTTAYQIPKEVKQQIPEAVSNEIEKKYPNIRTELEQKMLELSDSVQRARVAAENLEKLSVTHDQRLASLETAIKTKRFHNFGHIKCGKTITLTVPDGTTDDWSLFGANPNISAETAPRASGDNALFSIETAITTQDNKKVWSVKFSVYINDSTNSKANNRQFQYCDSKWFRSTPTLQILAARIT